MNTLNLISSALALGAMMGISGTHFQQVKAMVANGPRIQVEPRIDATDDAEPAPPRSPVHLVSASTNPEQASDLSLKHPTNGAKLAPGERDSALMEILIAIRKDNENLRKQLSNTNRNMDELTFRVDSHSTQFRPLQTDPNARPRAMVIPDDEYGASMGSGDLLPPK